ncbi:MAG: hypothetical protein AABZ06_14130 [Bdellovibrionota bacterium]
MKSTNVAASSCVLLYDLCVINLQADGGGAVIFDKYLENMAIWSWFCFCINNKRCVFIDRYRFADLLMYLDLRLASACVICDLS